MPKTSGGRRTKRRSSRRKKRAGAPRPDRLNEQLFGLALISGVSAIWTTVIAAACSNPQHPNYPVAAVLWFVTNILGSITGCCAAIGVLKYGVVWIGKQIADRRNINVNIPAIAELDNNAPAPGPDPADPAYINIIMDKPTDEPRDESRDEPIDEPDKYIIDNKTLSKPNDNINSSKNRTLKNR